MKKFYKVVQTNDGSRKHPTVEAALEDAQRIFSNDRSGKTWLVLMEAVEILEPPAAILTLKRTKIEDYQEPAAILREEDDF